MALKVPSYVPPQGWSRSTFSGKRGRRLLRDLTSMDKRYRRAAMNVFTKEVLAPIHEQFFEDVIRKAVQSHRRKQAGTYQGKAPQVVTVDPTGDPILWRQAIEEEAAKLDLNFKVKATPLYGKLIENVYEETSIRLGKIPHKHALRIMRERGQKLAQQVTGITQTTKLKMNRHIKDGIEAKMTVYDMVQHLREKYPTIASNRFPTIARTEMGRAADTATKYALKEAETVLEVSVIGCEAIEPGIPTYKGIPTCNITGVPREDVLMLHFHINHTGAIVPSKFVEDEDLKPTAAPPAAEPPKPKPVKPPEPKPDPFVTVIDPDYSNIPKPISVPVPPKPIDAAIQRAAELALAIRRFLKFRRSPTNNGKRRVRHLFRKVEKISEADQSDLFKELFDDQLAHGDLNYDLEYVDIKQVNTIHEYASEDNVKGLISADAVSEGSYAYRNAKGQIVLHGTPDQLVAQHLKSRTGKVAVKIYTKKPAFMRRNAAPASTVKPKPTASAPPVVVNVSQVNSPDVTFPMSLDKLEKVRNLGGSTGAQLVRDPDTGDLFVMKRGGSAAHLEEEMLSDTMYQAGGANVPAYQRYVDADGKPVKLATYIEGDLLKDLSAAKKRAAIKQIQKQFGLDAYMGNWDVGGTGLDNILVDKAGNVWRIDNGGSLRYRAQGKLKELKDFNAHDETLWTMRSKGNVAENLFGDMDWEDIEQSLFSIDYEAMLAKIPKKEKKLREMLKNRALQYRRTARMSRRYRQGDFTNDYQDKALKMGMGMRKHGMSEAMAEKIKLTGRGGTEYLDGAGRKYGGLRSNSSVSQAPTLNALDNPDDIYVDVLSAVKSLASHGNNGDFNYNGITISSHADTLGKATPKAIKHYQKHTVWINQAKKASKAHDADWFKNNPPPNVAKMPQIKLPAGTKAPISSPAEVLQAAARERFGGSFNETGYFVASWKNGQSGSSWNKDAMAHSYFKLEHATTIGQDKVFLNGWGKTRMKNNYDRWLKDYGMTAEAAEEALIFDHQYTMEVLEHMGFNGNDWENGVVLLNRSVPIEELAGKTGVLRPGAHVSAGNFRGPNVSGSIARPVNPVGGDLVTTQAVPHARVTGTYWQDRSWTDTHGSFAGDGENEFTFLAPDIDMTYHGPMHSARDSILDAAERRGTNMNNWDVPLGHLKKMVRQVLQKAKRLYIRMNT